LRLSRRSANRPFYFWFTRIRGMPVCCLPLRFCSFLNWNMVCSRSRGRNLYPITSLTPMPQNPCQKFLEITSPRKLETHKRPTPMYHTRTRRRLNLRSGCPGWGGGMVLWLPGCEMAAKRLRIGCAACPAQAGGRSGVRHSRPVARTRGGHRLKTWPAPNQAVTPPPGLANDPASWGTWRVREWHPELRHGWAREAGLEKKAWIEKIVARFRLCGSIEC
jgi:hypothetical protein